MIQNLIFGILFLKILFRAYNVFKFVQTFQLRTSEFLFNFRFHSKQNLAKKITHFTIQSRSKILTHFTNLNSLDIENNMLPQHMFFQKKYLHCTISWRPRTAFLKTLKANVCIFLYISSRKFLFQRRSKVLFAGGWNGGRSNNFHKACCLGLARCVTIFNFNWNFWNSTIF